MHNHNSIKLTVQYLTERYPERQGFTCREIYEVQSEVKKHLEQKNNINDIVQGVLMKHGVSREEWDDVLTNSNKFYWGPSPEDQTVNNDIRKALKDLEMINRPDGSVSYTAQRLRQFTKRGKWLFRYKENKLWYYHL